MKKYMILITENWVSKRDGFRKEAKYSVITEILNGASKKINITHYNLE